MQLFQLCNEINSVLLLVWFHDTQSFRIYNFIKYDCITEIRPFEFRIKTLVKITSDWANKNGQCPIWHVYKTKTIPCKRILNNINKIIWNEFIL